MKLLIATCLILISLLFIKVKHKNELKESIKRGNEIYNDFCMSCHLPSGEGILGTFPPLANSDYLMEKQTQSIRNIKFGINREITVNGTKYNSFMTPLGLSDDEIADVMNFVMNFVKSSENDLHNCLRNNLH